MSRELLDQFKAWQATRDGARPDFVEHLKSRAPWIFAHHPPHACFREHVWKINGLYICKGCLVTSVGFVTGLIAQAVSSWLTLFSEEQLAGIFILLLLPTLITGTFEWPRPFRHISRLLLGFLMASSLMLVFVTERWKVRLVVVATFIIVQRVFEKKRRRKNEEHLHRCS